MSGSGWLVLKGTLFPFFFFFFRGVGCVGRCVVGLFIQHSSFWRAGPTLQGFWGRGAVFFFIKKIPSFFSWLGV